MRGGVAGIELAGAFEALETGVGVTGFELADAEEIPRRRVAGHGGDGLLKITGGLGVLRFLEIGEALFVLAFGGGRATAAGQDSGQRGGDQQMAPQCLHAKRDKLWPASYNPDRFSQYK